MAVEDSQKKQNEVLLSELTELIIGLRKTLVLKDWLGLASSRIIRSMEDLKIGSPIVNLFM